jgi:hypothetical protein
MSHKLDSKAINPAFPAKLAVHIGWQMSKWQKNAAFSSEYVKLFYHTGCTLAPSKFYL